MNQIDFSLERIDFALRRRFVWYFYGYDKNRLREIISFESKKNEDDKLSIKDDHIEEFIKRASAINQTLENDEEFGKEWEIGHTFFAEIVNIAQRMVQQSLFIRSPKVKKEKTTQSKTKEEIEKIFTSAKEPVKVLWYISIKPMLEAYCGNLDKKTKKGKIEEFAKIILGK